ncbi:13401_t:CDS:1, partial [Entrophospora sp. SA101]
MSKKELLSVIQTLLGSLKANCPQFKGIKSKSKDELLSILQQ